MLLCRRTRPLTTALTKFKRDALEKQQKRNVPFFSGEEPIFGQLSGWDYMHNPRLNKGLIFSIEERMRLGIHGMFPVQVRTPDEQVAIYMAFLRRYQSPLHKFFYLNEIREINERIFFKMIGMHVEELMPIAYTPTVGWACQAYGMIYRPGRGMFITKYDKGNIRKVINNWPENDIRAVCMTDGERILGLGDLGAFGMGIPIGKLAFYTAVAGIKPHQLLPICIDIGTNNKKYLNDLIYHGIREPRIVGEEYNSFVDELVEALVGRWGCHLLIMFEDFSYKNAFGFLERYRHRYCVFNDDISGTAAAVLGGMLSAVKIANLPLEEHKSILMFGSGSCNLGVANLMIDKMVFSGKVTRKEAESRFWFMDIDGLLTTDREDVMKDPLKIPFAKQHAQTKDLHEMVKEAKPSILIGGCTVGKMFTPAILKTMGENHKRPIIFALSNPTAKAECTGQEAYDHTEGRAIYASGSPMKPVQFGGKTYYMGQGNNAYAFPGIALGVVSVKIHFVVPEFFLIAAQVVCDMTTPEMMAEGRVYPPLNMLGPVSFETACRMAEYAYCKGLAMLMPKPVDLRAHIKSVLYKIDFETCIAETWNWPKQTETSKLKFDEKFIKDIGMKKL